jgi:osmotically-inducible protein OsmY
MPSALSQIRANARSSAAETRIEKAAEQRLRESGYAPLRNVACCCRAATAVLTGEVPSFHMKQIAQTLVLKIDGVEQVDNLLEVVAR